MNQKVDPRNLRVAEVVRLLNSTPLGEVVQPHVIYKHVNRAGYRVGNGQRIDLPKYAAWLFHQRRQSLNVEAGEGGYAQAIRRQEHPAQPRVTR